METNPVEKTAAIAVPCPAPFSVTVEGKEPYFDPADCPLGKTPSDYQLAFSSTQANRVFAHTIVWKPKDKCCKVTSAVLTVKLKSIQQGTSQTSSDAGNDTIAVRGIQAGPVVPPIEGYIYTSFPFAAGTAVTKTFQITGTALDKLNCNHTLSFFVQDDTTVISASLALTGCCLGKIC